MTALQHVPVMPLDPTQFEEVIPAIEYELWRELIERAGDALRGRVVWNVNSTAKGGGVVELLRPLLGYARGAGVDARWVVIEAEPEFFAITKRLHDHLHGIDGGHGGVDPEERVVYERDLRSNAAELAKLVRPQDVVVLHDPQTAGLVDPMRAIGATVIWRCHVGMDRGNPPARGAWHFLRPFVIAADAYVFSRSSFAWQGLPTEKIAVIHPSIDVFSPKNADQTHEQSLAILARAGLTTHRVRAEPIFARSDGTPGRVDRRADLDELAPIGPDDRFVAQVSRWDRLKDPLGVLKAFAQHISERSDAHLVLAGPATDAITDDPDGAAMFASVREAWYGLPDQVRRRVHIASLPMEDVEENAAIVNALQRNAEIVTQKSLAEGFGLTVGEAMWKRRPVVASRIGGIQDQIVDGESGVLISNPRDLAEFGDAVVGLLSDRDRAQRMGAAAHERVREQLLAPHHLELYFELVQRLINDRDG